MDNSSDDHPSPKIRRVTTQIEASSSLQDSTTMSSSPSSSSASSSAVGTKRSISHVYSNDEKRCILGVNTVWPECEYHERSKRRAIVDAPSLIDSLAKLVEKLRGLNERHEIAVDGMNGVGKTMLCEKLQGRRYCKINGFAADVTRGSSYNMNPMKAIEYVMIQCLTEVVHRPDLGAVWDRCPYSNLIFYFVHHLMAVYGKDSLVPRQTQPVYEIFNSLALATGFFHTISYLRSLKDLPIVILVCSDLTMISQALTMRGDINDVYNAKESNYQMAQLHAYTYVGQCIGATVIDIADFVNNDGNMTLGDLQSLLIHHLSYKSAVDCSTISMRKQPEATDCDTSDNRQLLIYPYRAASQTVIKFSQYDDSLLYNFSLK